jgi:hypothetical protein
MRRRRKKRVAEYSVPVVLPLAELAAGNAQVEDPVARLVDRIDVLANHDACVWVHQESERSSARKSTRHGQYGTVLRGIILLDDVAKDVLHDSNELIFSHPGIDLGPHLCPPSKVRQRERYSCEIGIETNPTGHRRR